MRARLPLIAIENYLNKSEKSIADNWTLEGVEEFDKDTLLASIIFKAGTFEPIYTDPDYFYLMCGYFWKKWERTFTKWFTALNIEYNPLENYDRYEEWSESNSGSDSGTNSTTDNRTISVADNRTETTDNDTSESLTRGEDSTTENSISAFDENSYSDHDKSETDTDIEQSITGTNDTTFTSAGTSSTTDNNSIANMTSNESESELEHEGHLHGNIGIVSSQEMLKSELDISSWNIYEHMSDIFIRDLLVSVY